MRGFEPDQFERTMSNAPTVVRMHLVGGNPAPQVQSVEGLPGKVNYFLGNDPQQWHTNIPTYARVEYRDVYPGVNLVYYGNPGQLEYDFVVAPGADPAVIRLAFAGGVHGRAPLQIDAQGDLVLQSSSGEIRLHQPRVYQEIDGVQRAISAHYVLLPQAAGEGRAGGDVQLSIQVAAYDTGKPLIIDPVLSYSTYLGGSSNDSGTSIAVDGAGNVYVAGATESANFPTAGPVQATYGGGLTDAFVAKLNATGSALVYATYLGGNSNDSGNGIAVDASGNAYVTGRTGSANFPTVNPLQGTYAGGFDAFVAKLNAAGSALIYSTYLGGSGEDNGVSIALDASGNAYIGGLTASTNFPTTVGAFQTANAGGRDTFVSKLNAAGSSLVYSTYLGGSGNEDDVRSTVDPSGNVYVAGRTASTDFPTVNALQPTNGGGEDAFVAKLNAAGSSLVYSTYLGGSGNEDSGSGIAVDASGNAYVTGHTNSSNFPTTAGAFQPAYGGGIHDAFVAKLNAAGSALLYSTYLGGSGDDNGVGIAVDASGHAYVTGGTTSTSFPTASAVQAAYGGGQADAFVTKLNAAGSGLIYSTYLGGSGSGAEAGSGIAVDSSGNAYVTGSTNATDFPTANPLQATKRGGQDAFVAKIDTSTRTFVYIANQNSGTVSVIDTVKAKTDPLNAVIATVPVGDAPFGVAVHPDGTFVYIANQNSGTVSAIDTVTYAVVKIVPVGLDPEGVVVDPAGTFVYVANHVSGTVSVIDTATQSVVTTISVADGPSGVAIHPAGTFVYVASHGNGARVLSVIDTATWGVVASVGTLRVPIGVAVHPAGTFVYVVNHDDAAVSVIDTTTQSVVTTVPVEFSPYGVAVHPAGTFAYVTNEGRSSVSVIDTSTHTVVQSIGVGAGPLGLAVHPNGSFLYVANYASDTVSVIDTAKAKTDPLNAVIATVPVGHRPVALGQFIAQVAGAPNAPPKISSFTATPAIGTAPLSVSFAVDASDPDGVIASVEWDFDGNATVDQTTTGLTTSFTYTTAGTFTPVVTVVDDAGARASATTTVTVTNLPPETTITATPPALSNSASASFSFTASQAGSTFECRLDSGGFAPCSSPKSYGSLADGSHPFQVRAVFPPGNPDPTPASYTWTVDTTAPETTITASPPVLSNSRSASFSFAASEAGSSFMCSLDGGPFMPCSSLQTFTGLADGVHTLQVIATDPASNPDATPSIYSWTVDTVAPSGAVSINGGASVTNSTAATLSLSCSDPGGSGCAEVQLAADGVADTEPFVAFAITAPLTLPAGDGTKTVAVKFKDAAGNISAPVTASIILDTTPPDTTITAQPPALTNSASASFSFSATEAGSSFACSLDGVPFGTCSSPKSYGGLADGSHTFQVRAIDPAGNADPTPASYTWTVDTTPPDTTITAQPLPLTNSPSASFSFSATEAGSSFMCSLDGAAFVACAGTQTFPGLTDGVHTLQVRATDAAGNPDATAATYTWTVDTTPPAVTLTSPGIDEVLTTSPATVMVMANDTVGVASVRVNGVGAALVAGTPQSGTWQAAVPVTLPVPVGGALTFTATATDQATNMASATTVVDNDGIAAVIDTDATAFSNDFSDMASGGTTTGTITTRGGWTLRVVEVSPGGVQVSLAGTGTTARIATCAAGGAESVELDGAGETATITCVNTTGSNTGSRVTADLATAPATNPRIILRNASGAIRARLSTGQTATVGSPITADPANTEPVLVELVDPLDVPYGSFELEAAASVEVTVTPSHTVEVTVVSGTTTLTIAGQTTTLRAGQAQTFGTVAIDIKPGSAPNSINPRSQGKIPVAILSHATLDAPTQVDRASLTFGRTGNERSLAFCEQDGLQDVNGDGRLDLVCHFHTPAAGFQAGDTQGMLKGKTMAGVSFTGLDAVRIVPAR